MISRPIEWLIELFSYRGPPQPRTRKYHRLRYRIKNPLYRMDGAKLERKARGLRLEDLGDGIRKMELGVFGFIDPESHERMRETGVYSVTAVANRSLETLRKIFPFLRVGEIRRMKRICDKIVSGDRRTLRGKVCTDVRSARIARETEATIERNFERFRDLFELAGREENLVWVVTGFDDHRTCPYCRALSGRIIPREMIFDWIPPFHIGCRCTIALFQEDVARELSEERGAIGQTDPRPEWFRVDPSWE